MQRGGQSARIRDEQVERPSSSDNQGDGEDLAGNAGTWTGARWVGDSEDARWPTLEMPERLPSDALRSMTLFSPAINFIILA